MKRPQKLREFKPKDNADAFSEKEIIATIIVYHLRRAEKANNDFKIAVDKGKAYAPMHYDLGVWHSKLAEVLNSHFEKYL